MIDAMSGPWLDATIPIRPGMTVYEGDPPVRLERVASIAAGDLSNLTGAELGLHSGTHIDAPVHFIDGAPGIEAVPLDALIGPALVVDATAIAGEIGADAVRVFPLGNAERVLFKTTNSRLWDLDRFSPDFVGLSEEAANQLVQWGVRLVGIDYLSIAAYQDAAPTHRALLNLGVVILEGLDLRRVDPGEYEMVCLPLLVPGSDGAPARVLLRAL